MTDPSVDNGAARDAEIAERLAREVAESASGLTWRKVTTLLDLFGAYRLTKDVRGRIATAVADAGLEAKPSIAQVQRFETVRLSLPEATEDGDSGRARTMSRLLPLDTALKVTRWRPGHPPESGGIFSMAGDSIAWYDVDVMHTEPELVFDALGPMCPGLTEQMVVDLFTVDPRPHVHAYDDTPDVRLVSAVSVHADETEEGPSDADASKAGVLVFQLVEMLAGEGWLITCWHRSKRYSGAEEIAEGPPEGHETVYRGAEHWWCRGDVSTAGDLATLVLHELVLTYPSTARVLLSWLEQWELDFHKRFDETERHTLIDVRSLLAEFEERLAGIERPEAAEVADAWFTGLTSARWAQRVQELVERALRDAQAIHGALRASLDLLAVHSAAQQLRLAQFQASQSEKLQTTVALVTSVLLVPTLIAGIFGSNTMIPGQGTWWGFILLVALMVGGATATWAFLRPRRRGE